MRENLSPKNFQKSSNLVTLVPHSKIKPKTTTKNVATTEKVLQPTTTTSSTGTVNKIVSSFISYAPICATATVVDVVVVVVVVVVIVVVDVVVVYLYLRIVLSLLLLAGLFNQSGVCAFK